LQDWTFNRKRRLLLSYNRHKTLSFVIVLEIIATLKFPRSIPLRAQYAVTEGIFRRFLLPWKQNPEAGLMWKMTKLFFYICSVNVQQLLHWRNCTFGGPRTFCLVLNWATCLERLRTPALDRWANKILYIKFFLNFLLPEFITGSTTRIMSTMPLDVDAKLSNGSIHLQFHRASVYKMSLSRKSMLWIQTNTQQCSLFASSISTLFDFATFLITYRAIFLLVDITGMLRFTCHRKILSPHGKDLQVYHLSSIVFCFFHEHKYIVVESGFDADHHCHVFE